ncbi:hypothetical protein OfM1_04500 [Lactovum odontotermitis]
MTLFESGSFFAVFYSKLNKVRSRRSFVEKTMMKVEIKNRITAIHILAFALARAFFQSND